MSYDHQTDIIDLIRNWSPLALYVFSKDSSWAMDIVKQTRSGGVCINDCFKQFTNLDLPFGGIGQSGYGAYHGSSGFETFSHFRAMTVRNFLPDPFTAFPPYQKIYSTIRKFVRVKI
jgi:acyl-CoA reductase-like NAD-dependent aldehyde dehydrogenase